MLKKCATLPKKEADLQAEVLEYLRLRTILHWRQNLGAVVHSVNGKMIFRKNSMKGFPDIAGLLPNGRFFAIELKSKSGRLSDEQKAWIDNLESNGASVAVCRTLDEVIEFIEPVLRLSAIDHSRALAHGDTVLA